MTESSGDPVPHVGTVRRGRVTVELMTGLGGFASELGRSLAFASVLTVALDDGRLQQRTLTFLLAALAGSLIIALGSRNEGVASGTRGSGALIMVAAATGLSSVSADERTASFAIAVAAATGLCAVLYAVLAQTPVRRVARYLPASAIAGFGGAIGVQLMISAGQISGIGKDSVAHSTPIFLAAIGSVALIVVASRGRLTGAVAAASLTVVSLAFAAFAFFVDKDSLRESGWYLFPQGDTPDLSPGFSLAVDWSAVIGLWVTILVTGLVGALSLLLTTASLLDTRLQDERREFRLASVGNLAAAALGGLPVQQLIADTLARRSAGSRGPWAAMLAALLGVLTVVFAWSIIAEVPRFASAAMLMVLGIGLLTKWFNSARAAVDRSDLLQQLVFVVGVLLLGLPLGLLVGLFAVVILVAIQLAQVRPIQQEESGGVLRSSVARTAQEHQFLTRAGNRTWVFTLQGYLFFGTAERVVEDIAARIAQLGEGSTIIVDVGQASGIDGAAVERFNGLADWADARSVRVEFCGRNDQVGRLLTATRSADDVLSAREDELLRGYGPTRRQWDSTLRDFLSAEQMLVLAESVSEIQLSEGERLVSEGAVSDAVFIVVSGLLKISHEAKGPPIREIGPGAVVGELGFVIGAPRSASIIAVVPSRVIAMNREMWKEFALSPEMGVALQRWLLSLVAHRLRALEQTPKAFVSSEAAS